MATFPSLILDCEDLLYGNAQVERPAEDQLAEVVANDSDTEWKFLTPKLWRFNDRAEWVDGLGNVGEIVVMAEDHPDLSAVTVRRGQKRTDLPGAHYPADSVWRHNPTFDRARILRAITEVIDNELGPYVWVRVTRDITWVDNTYTYELEAGDYQVERIYQYNLGTTPDTRVYPFDNGWFSTENVLHTDLSSTNVLVRIWKVWDSTEPVYLTVRSRPSSTRLADLPVEITNMIPYGAVGKLLLGRAVPVTIDPTRGESARKFSRSQEQQDSYGFMGEFIRMRTDYINKLRSEFTPQKNYVHRRTRR